MAHCEIAVFDCDGEERQLFSKELRLSGVCAEMHDVPLDADSARRVSAGCAVSVSHRFPVDAAAIACLRGRGVRYLTTRSIGVDHIDLCAAARLGVEVEPTAYSPQSVAEHTLLLMLMAIRGVRPMLDRVRRLDFRLGSVRARELREMTVGVVGTGRIGRAVLDRLRGFGCRTLAYDPMPGADVRYVGFETVLQESDLITLHLPLTAGTRHIISRESIGRMRAGAILVNAARGGLVDSDALADALEEGRLAGAALDVVEGETGWFYFDCSGRREAPPFERLLRLPNVILTPHTAFYTRPACEDVVRNTIANCLEHTGRREKWIS